MGKDTELDRTVVDALGDPLVHLVRNSLDHGLEPPEERLAAGKPATGTLEISARHAGGNVIISVRDDGRGIDPARVARKAAERGLIAGRRGRRRRRQGGRRAALPSRLLHRRGHQRHLRPRRRHGRRARRRSASSAARCCCTPSSARGTTAQVRLPLTLAIMAALLVEIGGRPFAVPIDRVERTVKLADHAAALGRRRRGCSSCATACCRSSTAAPACAAPPTPEADHAVIVRDRRGAPRPRRRRKLVGQQELVTRPLPSEVAEHAALSGGAVLPDGQIALIVDCDALGEGAARLPAPALA